MSRLYNDYLKLKDKNKDKYYVFKSGIFYILLADDAKYFSEVFSFKLTKLNDNVVKCGFPVKSKEKYFKLMKSLNIEYEIIDYSLLNINVTNFIKNIDIYNITKEEAFKLIQELYNKVNNE